MLRFAYISNIVILIPVALSTISSTKGADAVFEGKFSSDSPLRILVGSIWTAILICSVVGLFKPNQMIAILFLQIIYKGLFLINFIFPVWRDQGTSAIPMGITLSFLFIVLIWPVILWKTSGQWL